MHAAAFCKVFTCHRSLYDRIHMSCITIRIMIATFTPVAADLPLLPSRCKFNPALGQIYPRATFTPAWCIRGMSFFKFTLAIPLGFVHTVGAYGPRGYMNLGHAAKCGSGNQSITQCGNVVLLFSRSFYWTVTAVCFATYSSNNTAVCPGNIAQTKLPSEGQQQ